MTYLSSWRLTHRQCLELRMKDAYSLHRAVLGLFPREKERSGRILFADKGFHQGRRQILILSGIQPELGPLGELGIKMIPEAFLDFSAYNFEIVMNPVRRKNASGRIEPVRGDADIAAWFGERAEKWGFRPLGVQVLQLHTECFRRSSETEVTLSRARLTGSLEVLERTAFKNSFRSGLGRGKAFGCGLLQLRPIA